MKLNLRTRLYLLPLLAPVYSLHEWTKRILTTRT